MKKNLLQRACNYSLYLREIQLANQNGRERSR